MFCQRCKVVFEKGDKVTWVIESIYFEHPKGPETKLFPDVALMMEGFALCQRCRKYRIAPWA